METVHDNYKSFCLLFPKLHLTRVFSYSYLKSNGFFFKRSSTQIFLVVQKTVGQITWWSRKQ